MFNERNKIFLSQHVEKKEMKEGYWYSYLEENGINIFRVYKDDEIIFQQEAKIGDAFDAIFREKNGSIAYITQMTPPRKKWETVAWLLGYSKYARSCDYEEYLKLCDEKRGLYVQDPKYVESMLKGPNFSFTEYAYIGGDYQYKKAACWVSESITREEAIYLIPEYVYPEEYVRKVLREKFYISKEEFDKAFYEED